LRSKIGDLEKAAEYMAQAQTQTKGTNGAAPQPEGETKSDDDVIDADFTEKK
jgi:hypothetical protein